MSNSFINIPLGFKFAPTDHEIITYLLHKITRTNIPGDELIINAEVFGDLPPWILCENSSSVNAGVVKYFFTAVKKKGKNGTKNFKRTVGEIGTWRGEAVGEDIVNPKNKDVVLGMKKKLTFTTDLESKFKWLMTEYSLAGEYKEKYACGSDRHEYVICKIKKKINNRKCQKQVGVINLETAQQQSHSTIQTADLSQACGSTNINTNYSQGINSYNVGQQYCSAKNYLTTSSSAQVAYSDSRFVNNPVDSWSASNTIHQNNLQQFFPEDNNLESAQEQVWSNMNTNHNCSAENQNSAQVIADQGVSSYMVLDQQYCTPENSLTMSNSTAQAAYSSQGVECSIIDNSSTISELEQLQQFMNEADDYVFDSLLDDNEVNFDEMMNIDTEEVLDIEEEQQAADQQSKNNEIEDEDYFKEIDDLLEMNQEDVTVPEKQEVADSQSQNEDEDNFDELHKLLDNIEEDETESQKQVEEECFEDDAILKEFSFLPRNTFRCTT